PALAFSSAGTDHTRIIALSLHDALPISDPSGLKGARPEKGRAPDKITKLAESTFDFRGDKATLTLAIFHFNLNAKKPEWKMARVDRKSTRLNSSHLGISYAVFCLKKKKV